MKLNFKLNSNTYSLVRSSKFFRLSLVLLIIILLSTSLNKIKDLKNLKTIERGKIQEVADAFNRIDLDTWQINPEILLGFQDSDPNSKNWPLVIYKNGSPYKFTTLGKELRQPTKFVSDIEQIDYNFCLINKDLVITSTSPILIGDLPADQLNRLTVEDNNLGGSFKGDHFSTYLRNRVLSDLMYVIKKKPSFLNYIRSVRVTRSKGDDYKVNLFYKNILGQNKILVLPLNNDYVSVKFDEDFNKNSFLWDESFVSWFALDTDIELSKSTLDFWYSLQIKNGKNKGLIPREIRPENYSKNIYEFTNKSKRFNPISVQSFNNLQVSNPFILGRLELEIYQKQKNKNRLMIVLPKLENYFNWVENNRKEVRKINNKEIYYYHWSNLGTGMDNSPRCLNNKNCGYSDLIAQQAALANEISKISNILEDKITSNEFQNKFSILSKQIQDNYYDPATGFIFDLDENGNKIKDSETIASVWALYAKTLTNEQSEKFIKNYLLNPIKFGRVPYFPSVARDSNYFDKSGRYWMGGVWHPMIWISYIALKENGHEPEAKKIINYYYDLYQKSFNSYGTLYEYYAPELDVNGIFKPGENPNAREDFYGWSTLALKLYEELHE